MENVIHQFVHTLSYGDAISTEVLALRDFFAEEGYRSEIYCINAHPKYKGLALDYREFIKKNGVHFRGGIVLHYSLGSPLNELYRKLKGARRFLIYHNLTPPCWFEGVNPRIVEDIKRGMKELPELCTLSDLLVADSAYNASQLKGFDVEVLSLPVNAGRWNVNSNAGIASLLESEGGLHILHVGRLAPNKRIEDILKVFYFLHYHIESHSRLWLVGTDIDTEIYSYSLKRLAYELHIGDRVEFTGALSDEEVRALYEGCSAYLCMSEHEGFCLPLVEAMRFKLPVVAYSSTAIPETLGDGGILVSEKKYPETAELLYRVCTDQNLRGRMIAKGLKRIESFSVEAFKRRAGEIFLSGALRRTENC
ncbi:MAG: glycosyltransferase [Candidatus Dadabacteria bacterium]|nr:MAG: glycosyltransferase [Candidatus Dadabacteria bacterium]